MLLVNTPNLLNKAKRFGPDNLPGSLLSPQLQYVPYMGHKASFVPSSSARVGDSNDSRNPSEGVEINFL